MLWSSAPALVVSFLGALTCADISQEQFIIICLAGAPRDPKQGQGFSFAGLVREALPQELTVQVLLPTHPFYRQGIEAKRDEAACSRSHKQPVRTGNELFIS